MKRKSLRTMTFVPAYMQRFLNKASAFPSDALVFDLEDSVPDAYKSDARANIAAYLEASHYPQQIFIRVNPINSGMLMEDLQATVHPRVTGYMVTKFTSEKDVVHVDHLLTQLERDRGLEPGSLRLCVLIETAHAVMRAFEIATASSRIVALAFGGEDYLTELDGLHKEHGLSLIYPRSLIVIAARAANVEPIDTPYLDVRNAEGLRRELEISKEMGFSGALVIHPSQIDIANEVFSPSEAEIVQAREIVRAIEQSQEAGLGVALIGGELVGPPMLKRAQSVLRKMEMIEAAQEEIRGLDLEGSRVNGH